MKRACASSLGLLTAVLMGVGCGGSGADPTGSNQHAESTKWGADSGWTEPGHQAAGGFESYDGGNLEGKGFGSFEHGDGGRGGACQHGEGKGGGPGLGRDDSGGPEVVDAGSPPVIGAGSAPAADAGPATVSSLAR